MEAFTTRYRSYRSLVILVSVVAVQLVYLAYQVKTSHDERLIRVWAVSAVTPVAGIVDSTRHNTVGFWEDYFQLLHVREQNRDLQSNNDKLKLENIFLRNQLATAEHARALTLFQSKSQSKTVAARVIGDSTVSTAKAVFIDRGSTSGVEKGMAVVTPDGVVGKVAAVYPLVSQVLLVTDSTFKVGVESQKGHVHGSLNCGSGQCVVEHIQNEDDISVGEGFFTSGEDRIFPRGFPVGKVTSAQAGTGMKDVHLNLSGAPGGVDEVLVVLEGVHEAIPTGSALDESVSKALPPPPAEKESAGALPGTVQTEADKLRQKYQELGKEQGHVFGALYSNMPNYNAKPPSKEAKTASEAPGGSAPPPAKPGGEPKRPVASTSTAPAVHPIATPKRSPAGPAGPGKPTLPLGSPRPKPPVAMNPASSQPSANGQPQTKRQPPPQ